MENAQYLDASASAPGSSSPLETSWHRVREKLKGEVGEVEYRTWLRQIVLGPLEDGELILYLPTRFLRDWVRSQYEERLQTLWRTERQDVQGIELQVKRGLPEVLPSVETDGDSVIEEVTAQVATSHEVRSDLAVPLDPRFSFDTFIVGKPNEFAYACARRVAEKPSSPGFNPLFLYGGVGLGKTHLMHAIGSELTKTGNVSVAYMSAEKFMYRFIAAIRSQSTMEFKEQLRSVDVLMIDDLQFLIGKDNTQEEFFHTFNALVDAGRQIIVSADKSPSDLSGLEDRLRTRLGCGMVADIHATTFELRISILEAKAKASGTHVPSKVLEYLAHKITSNVRELEGALNRLVAHADLVGRPVTLDTTQDVLKDMLKAHDRRVTIEEIQRKVAEHWNIRLTDMSSARRARAVARPRQVAMFLAKQLTSRSLPEIGRKFGNRDHTTVMHAVNRVGELMEQDPSFAEDVELLRRMLEG
ncbi:chromosomal replication initiator protein DnaA [Gluconobacter cerinus]|uniref:Chromosomal replication initiator protein DnaA n=1 Tax=Gluconobacter cerinus TaxID=38307 RepID=A0A1B6VP24_9PROT|nr:MULTISPECIES: chromosomal replication initiator protein DnaA [Gluconobacter]MBM3096420.1 chromosomal replication initiator protein DnaA [Gluconobacter cerinus]MBS0982733.1 chromosomal replication initiator protein DnaA [Gluconobacter cerinus]MBS1025705.1 chromosomal replication initiator protein DnaA [Gluconobacter cerinus]MBS1031021.1 chromosomal replication initiator protein DnaA [Gluconobacter cerinus]MBS1035081.1 chromosomal replication initiator protein DnaA [Gluconobacter cerinus]